MHAHFFGASNFKTLCYTQSDTIRAMISGIPRNFVWEGGVNKFS